MLKFAKLLDVRKNIFSVSKLQVTLNIIHKCSFYSVRILKFYQAQIEFYATYPLKWTSRSRTDDINRTPTEKQKLNKANKENSLLATQKDSDNSFS